MTSKSKRSNEFLCGGRVRVFYVWESDELVYSEIQRTDKQYLIQSLETGHLLVKATKALVKTTEDVEAYKLENHCKLRIQKPVGAPLLTDVDMSTINRHCEVPTKEKIKQITALQTLPVMAEKLSTKDIFAKEFQSETVIECEYEPHDPELLDKHPIEVRQEYNCVNKTANRIKFPSVFMLFYGNKYKYKIDMKTEYTKPPKENSRMTIIFYGYLYETTNSALIGYERRYVVGLSLPVLAVSQTTDSGYDSDIDDYDFDKSSKELENEGSEKKIAKRDEDKTLWRGVMVTFQYHPN